MKSYILPVILLMMVSCRCSSGSPAEVDRRNAISVRKLYILKGLSDLWTWIRDKGKHEDNFIGRCFGAARKLKIVMPMIIFKLGIIVTTLAFLTMFSLKSLALLILLVIMHSTGWAAKLALFKHNEEPKYHYQPKPNNVHFHIHQSKDGHYKVGHHATDALYEDWDRNSVETPHRSLEERLQQLNVYDSYRR